MAVALDTDLLVQLAATLTNPLDLATGREALSKRERITLPNGTGSGQANRLFHDRRTIAASGTDDLDLAGSLLDGFGNTLTFARVKLLLVKADPGNTNNVVVGGDATAAWASWAGAATHTVTVRPGGLLVLAAPDATAYVVTATTADILQIANSGGGTGVTYDIVLVGSAT